MIDLLLILQELSWEQWLTTGGWVVERTAVGGQEFGGSTGEPGINT